MSYDEQTALEDEILCALTSLFTYEIRNGSWTASSASTHPEKLADDLARRLLSRLNLFFDVAALNAAHRVSLANSYHHALLGIQQSFTWSPDDTPPPAA